MNYILKIIDKIFSLLRAAYVLIKKLIVSLLIICLIISGGFMSMILVPFYAWALVKRGDDVEKFYDWVSNLDWGIGRLYQYISEGLREKS